MLDYVRTVKLGIYKDCIRGKTEHTITKWKCAHCKRGVIKTWPGENRMWTEWSPKLWCRVCKAKVVVTEIMR